MEKIDNYISKLKESNNEFQFINNFYKIIIDELFSEAFYSLYNNKVSRDFSQTIKVIKDMLVEYYKPFVKKENINIKILSSTSNIGSYDFKYDDLYSLLLTCGVEIENLIGDKTIKRYENDIAIFTLSDKGDGNMIPKYKSDFLTD